MVQQKLLGDFEGTAAEQVQELQYKLRHLENDKRKYMEEVQSISRRQRLTVEKLQKENRELKTQALFMRTTGTEEETKGSSGGKTMNNRGLLELQKDRLELAVAAEAKRDAQLTDAIATLEKKLEVVRGEVREIGGRAGARRAVNQVSTSIGLLENRLDKTIQRFNEVIAQNKAVRAKVDELRKERVTFDNISRKLNADLLTVKTRINTVIEHANSAYETRDGLHAKMQQLKAQSDREHAEFEKEWKELNRLLENDAKMKQFIRSRDKERELKDQRNIDRLKNLGQANKHGNPGEAGNEQVNLADIQGRRQVYEDAFSKIQASTGITSIDALVQQFTAAEEKSFSLYTYSSQLARDIDSLARQELEIKAEVAKVKRRSSEVALRGQLASLATVLANLEDKSTLIQKRSDYYDLKFHQTSKSLQALKAGIESIASRLDVALVPQPAVSLELTTVAWLAEVETAVDALVTHYLAEQDSQGDNPSSLVTGKKTTTARSAPVTIKVPSTLDPDSESEEDADEVDRRPLSSTEIRAKIVKKLGKRRMLKIAAASHNTNIRASLKTR